MLILLLLSCTGDKVAADDSQPKTPTCAGSSPTELQDCVDVEDITADITQVTGERIAGGAHWQEVQDLCADRLESLGFTVERQSFDGGVNVIGTLEGSSDPNTAVLLGAHYDSVADCPGADDNASGVAALLESAEVLSSTPHARTLILACWDQEEPGWLGSIAWVNDIWLAENAANGQQLAAVYIFETMAYTSSEPNSQTLPNGFTSAFPDAADALEARDYAGDFLFYAADERHSEAADTLELAAAEVGLPLIGVQLSDRLKAAAGDLRRSDHAPFWDADLPGLFVTDTANFRNDGYHCYVEEDTLDRLNLDFLRQGTAASVGAAARMLNPG